MKNPMRKGKSEDEVKIIHPPLKSKKDNATLEYDEITDRYDLCISGKIVLSSTHHDCLHRAKKHDVKWDK